MAQSQAEVYEQAKQSIASELDNEILAWDFETMLSQLKAIIEKKAPEETGKVHNSIRFFCRHYLAMHGSTFNDMRQWLLGRATMPFEKIQMVLRVLKSEREGSLVRVPPNTGGRKYDHVAPRSLSLGPERAPELDVTIKPEPPTPKTSGVVRTVIDHTGTTLNSLMILIVQAHVSPDDLFDGDRMRVRIAIEEICKSFGINVVFPKPESIRSRPVTSEDFAKAGLTGFKPRTERKERRKNRNENLSASDRVPPG